MNETKSNNLLIEKTNLSRKELFIKYIRFWDWKAYKLSDKKLHNLTDTELLIHVLDHSIPIEKWKIFIKKKNKNFLSANTIINNFDLLLPKDFDWKNYIALNKDIKNNEKYAKVHYILYGNLENREYNTINTNNSYKYISSDNFSAHSKMNKLWVHLHCYDIDKFNEIYGHYIENIIKYFSVVITYSKGDNIPNYDFTPIKIDNENIDLIYFVKKHLNEKKVLYLDILTYNNAQLEYFKKLYNSKIVNLNTKKLNNNITYENNINYTTLDDFELVYTNNYNNKYNYNTLQIKKLEIIKNYILVIDFPNMGGGTTIFLNKIISKFKKYNTFLIIRNINNKITLYLNDDYKIIETLTNKEAISYFHNNSSKIQKIFINHTIYFNEDFLDKLFELDKEKIFITHDYYSINDNPQPYANEFHRCKTKEFLNKCSCIVTQNECNLNYFSNFINNKKCEIIISNLPDYKNKGELIKTKNTEIIIGVIGNINKIKGSDILYKIYKYFENVPNIKLIVFGGVQLSNNKNEYIESYYYSNVRELNKLLIKYSPNILLELSVWPETYSFTLTLGMITNLPILFLKKTKQFTVENRLSNYKKAYSFTNLYELLLLVLQHKQDFFYTIENNIYYNSFWNRIFNRNNNKKNINKEYVNDLTIFPIYFPQFHEIIENNKNFYTGFTDTVSLSLTPENFEKITPSINEFNISSITDYNLLNTSILIKQIEILDEYNFKGFAMYHYWFSRNDVSKSNHILNSPIDLFFSNSVPLKGKKIYFVWCNENWTNNNAFGKTDLQYKIENSYNKHYINLHIDYLMKYFKNNDYLKINNKPVFSIHHPWFITIEELELIKTIFNKKCIDNGFDGIEIMINTIKNDYENINLTKYIHNFNYKKNNNTFYGYKKQIYLDVKKYYEIHKPSDDKINMLTFDFDNRTRLFKPNKLECSTIAINNSEFEKIKIINRLKSKKNKNKQNILLINSWNEWGERMAIEPSNEYGYYYLNLINEYLGI